MKVISNVSSGEYSYILTAKQICAENEIFTVYGIGISGDGRRELVDDISCDKEDVEQLFSLVVEGCASPLHLRDIAEDHISV